MLDEENKEVKISSKILNNHQFFSVSDSTLIAIISN